MKVYCLNYNGILDGTIALLKERDQYTENYHDADCFLTWQDVRGDCKQFATIVTQQLKKPFFVLQHGRGATRDYCPPNNFKLTADKILVWGQAEKDRLLAVGVPAEKIAVVGCPLIKHLKPKAGNRDGINVLYSPVISSKEEPENLLAHAELKKWEAQKLQDNIYENFSRLKDGWATENTMVREVQKADGSIEQKVWKKEILPTIPRGVLYAKGLVNVKLCGVHDLYQYQSPIIVTNQNDPRHIEALADTLSNTDVVVCLEEGTMQLLACALDIPVIYVDIFNYGEYGGVKNYGQMVEKIATPAVYRINSLGLLGKVIDKALAEPGALRKQRIEVVKNEGGAHLGDADMNIISEIESFMSVPR